MRNTYLPNQNWSNMAIEFDENKMVELGSSEAYLFRENVITYKNIN